MIWYGIIFQKSTSHIRKYHKINAISCKCRQCNQFETAVKEGAVTEKRKNLPQKSKVGHLEKNGSGFWHIEYFGLGEV